MHKLPKSFLLFSDDTLIVPTEQRDIVREFIEELVASMIGGGSLDNVPIGQLYSSLDCKYTNCAGRRTN